MEFSEGKPIYVQIADRLREAVLQGVWSDEERIPSIREMAADAEVNPNTITRTYALLQDQGVIQNRRGIGYFISSGATESIKTMMRQDFIETEMPRFFQKAAILGLTIDEIVTLYRSYAQSAAGGHNGNGSVSKTGENTHENE